MFVGNSCYQRVTANDGFRIRLGVAFIVVSKGILLFCIEQTRSDCVTNFVVIVIVLNLINKREKKKYQNEIIALEKTNELLSIYKKFNWACLNNESLFLNEYWIYAERFSLYELEFGTEATQSVTDKNLLLRGEIIVDRVGVLNFEIAPE